MSSTSFNHKAKGWQRLCGPFLVACTCLLFVAWWLPLIETNHLLQWSPDNLSIMDGLVRLYTDGEMFLAGVILILAILVPFSKNLLSLFVWYLLDPKEQSTKTLVWILSLLGKWGMADVFLVALGVILVKGIPGAEISVQYGLWIFIAAVLSSMIGSSFMSYVLTKDEEVHD